MEHKVEQVLGEKIGTGPEALNMYLLRVRRHRILSRREEAALAARIQQRDGEAWEELVSCNLKLVVSVARGYMGRGLELADLIQEGNLGLMRAAHGFDAEFGTKFSTYAMWWIKQSITRALANKASTIRVPIHAAERERAVHGARNHLQAMTGRDPSVEELSEYVGKSSEEVAGVLNIRKSVVSYDMPIGAGDEGTLSDFLTGETEADAEELLMENALQNHVRNLLDVLPERERYVVERRYGLEGDGSATLEEIGAGIGVTRERVRQIQTSALRRLRAYALKAELGSLLDPCYSPAS